MPPPAERRCIEQFCSFNEANGIRSLFVNQTRLIEFHLDCDQPRLLHAQLTRKCCTKSDSWSAAGYGRSREVHASEAEPYASRETSRR